MINKMLNIIRGYSEKNVRRYYAFTFFRNFSFYGAVLVPFFTQWGHITLFQAQLLQSWFMLMAFLLEVPTGAIADRLGRKFSLVLSSFFAVLAALVYGSIPRFEVFMFGEFLFALAWALLSGADQALLYDTLKEEGREGEAKKIFGVSNAITLSGLLVTAPLGSFIAYRFGLNAPILLSAIPFLISAVIAFTLREPKVHQKVSESRRYLDVLIKGFVFFYRHKTLRLMVLDGVMVAAAGYFVIWLYQPLLIKAQVPILYFGYIQAFLVLCEIIVASNFTHLEKIFGSPKSFLSFSALITATAFLMVAIFPNIITIILFVALAGGFGLTRIEFMNSFTNTLIPSAQRATVLSSISMFRRLFLVILNPVVGLLADKSLTWALLFVFTLPLVIFLFSPLRKEMFSLNMK